MGLERDLELLRAISEGAGGVADNPETFEDSSFVVGDSPATLDINAALGRNATRGYIICDGAGNILVQFSTNGTDFGDSHTVKSTETLKFDKISIDSIKITHSGTDSAYRSSFV